MREITKSTSNFTKLDAINSKNGIALKDVNGQTLNVKSLAVMMVDDEEGQKEVGVINTTDGKCYTTISSNACEVIADTIPIIEEEGLSITFDIDVRTSKGNREFIAITLGIEA